MYSSFEISLGNNKVEDICTAPDRISPTKVCALVSAVVVVNSRLFVTPNEKRLSDALPKLVKRTDAGGVR